MFLKLILRFSIFLICFFCFSCQKSEKTSKDKIEISHFIQQLNDSLIGNPTYVKNRVSAEISSCKDSLDFYELRYLYASSCFKLTQFDSTLILTHQILSYCKETPANNNTAYLKARTQNLLGNYYNNMFLQDSALFYYQKALYFFQIANDRSTAILLYINLADVNIGKGNYATGVKWYKEALMLSDSIHSKDNLFSIHSGLGRAYMDLRDFQQSESHYRLGEQSLSDQPLIDQYIYCNNRGNMYYYWGRYKDALPWFQKALALVTPGKYEFHIQLSGLNLADIYLRLNQLDSAAYYAAMGKVYFKQIKHTSASYYNTAIRAGIALKRHHFSLTKSLLDSIKNPSGIDKNLVSIRNKIYIDYSVSTGDYRNAYACLLDNEALSDSLRADYTQKRAATYDMQYKLDSSLFKKNLFITHQKTVINGMKFRILLLITIGLAIILLTLFTILWQRKKRDFEALKFQGRLVQLRMQNIRNRISPHFIFNVLNDITAAHVADDRRELLILLLRKSLEMAEESLVTLEQELDFVHKFIQLERPNLGDDFTYDCIIDPEIEIEKVLIPPLFIQIPVENAIKHGLKPLTGEKRLAIHVQKAVHGVRIRIHDNGPGFSAMVAATAGTSTGMKVLHETVAYLNSRNAVKLSITLLDRESSEFTGTNVELFIPEKIVL